VSLREVHVWWAWVVVVANAVAGAWALGAHRYEGLRRPALWWYTLVAQLTVFVQVIVGVVLVNAQDYPLQRFHAFYGFVAIAAIGIIYSYRSQLRHRLYLLYGFGGLFVMGLAIRAMLLRT
jgi:uncharacterized membrane protein